MPNAAVKRAHEKPVERVIFTEPVNIGHKERRVFVLPPHVHIGGENPPKTIHWVNETGGDVTIWIPNAAHYLSAFEDPLTHEVHEIKPPKPGEFIPPFHLPAKRELFVTVKKDPPSGYYPYDVYCDVTQDYAQGNSSPVVCCP